MKFSSYLFDFDGTLADSMQVWSEKVIRILEEEGVEYPDDLISTVTPLGDLGTAEYLKGVLGVRASVDEILDRMNAYALPKYRESIGLKEGVLEYLSYLKRRECTLSLLTASPREAIIPCLRRNGIYEMFDNIWTCDDFGKSKADSGIYMDVSLILRAQPGKIAFFDDNLNALCAASKCGLFTVGVYDKSNEALSAELAELTDLYIRSFYDLPIAALKVG